MFDKSKVYKLLSLSIKGLRIEKLLLDKSKLYKCDRDINEFGKLVKFLLLKSNLASFDLLQRLMTIEISSSI